MSVNRIILIALVILITLISGWGDAQGFVHASKIWEGRKIVRQEVYKSALGFGVGIGMYWISLRFIQNLKILSPEVQTISWFSVTMVGVALLSGQFLHWRRTDQIVAVAVLFGIAWLLVRAAN